jgi:hypothetical protein
VPASVGEFDSIFGNDLEGTVVVTDDRDGIGFISDALVRRSFVKRAKSKGQFASDDGKPLRDVEDLSRLRKEEFDVIAIGGCQLHFPGWGTLPGFPFHFVDFGSGILYEDGFCHGRWGIFD